MREPERGTLALPGAVGDYEAPQEQADDNAEKKPLTGCHAAASSSFSTS
jgi:hypothetical protein